MRTTLDIDDEVLLAAKELARRESKTAGQVISELARRAMTQHVPASAAQSVREPEAFFGFQPFASRGAVVSNEQVDRLRDDEGI
ncbi:MAG: antitoxin [Rhodocyclales bacterium]|nr:MAG: antitoxin [Rhodocyclales bacterium]GIK25765.1 MAG: antitoxin [Betaproteobacteria bacterium]